MIMIGQVPNLVLRLSATNFSAPALLVNCHFDRCHHHFDLYGEEEEDDGDIDNDDEEVDDDDKDGHNHAQCSARSRGQWQHAQLCNHAWGDQSLKH